MYHHNIYSSIKALLIAGSAMVFVCCGSSGEKTTTRNEFSMERVMTESSDNLEIVMSENGRPSYKFKAPRVEGYNLAKEPYREFVQGVDITTYNKDEEFTVDGTLTANYAIYYEERELWEAMGDVVVKKTDGKELYSQQLFWNAQTERIYSNVDTKILDRTTGDVYLGEGFESDEKMEDWSFRKMKGRMKMDVTPKRPVVDSLGTADKADSLGMAARADSLGGATKVDSLKGKGATDSTKKVTAKKSPARKATPKKPSQTQKPTTKK